MPPDHYATLGLDRRATAAQIRAAYRVLAAQYHPDRNPDSPDAAGRMQELNAAHETLSDPRRRRIYDRDLDESRAKTRGRRIMRNISQDVLLPIEAFFRGTNLDVSVKDPANADGAEIYRLEVPPLTAPGSRFRLARSGTSEGGWLQVRVKVLPGYRFKARGADLKCDLRISTERATKGGSELMPGPAGQMVRIAIPARVARGEVLRVPGEGLPKPRGARGDLLVRIMYRPAVQISQARR